MLTNMVETLARKLLRVRTIGIYRPQQKGWETSGCMYMPPTSLPSNLHTWSNPWKPQSTLAFNISKIGNWYKLTVWQRGKTNRNTHLQNQWETWWTGERNTRINSSPDFICFVSAIGCKHDSSWLWNCRKQHNYTIERLMWTYKTLTKQTWLNGQPISEKYILNSLLLWSSMMRYDAFPIHFNHVLIFFVFWPGVPIHSLLPYLLTPAHPSDSLAHPTARHPLSAPLQWPGANGPASLSRWIKKRVLKTIRFGGFNPSEHILAKLDHFPK